MPSYPHGTIGQRLQCIFGLAVFILIAYAIGRFRNRHDPRTPFPWRAVGWGVVLQFAFAILVLWVPEVLVAITRAIDALLGFTKEGARVVFGNLVENYVPVTTSQTGPVIGVANTGALFAFFILPTIVFFSALTAVAYHSGIMQYVVQGLAWVMAKSMGTSGAETLSAAANIFVGQTEAPLMVRPFMAAATRSELMCIMVAGFANIASGVLGLYELWLSPYIPNAAGHLAAACLVSAPASLLVSKLLVPEVETPVTAGKISFKIERIDANTIDAAARGTTEGLALAINVGAMLVSFTALVAMVNAMLSWGLTKLHLGTPGQTITLQSVLAYPMAPVAWLSGVDWADSPKVGTLLGIKTVLNELLAYSQMKDYFAADPHFISDRSAIIAAYALCGFANFASVGIQVGGISTMAPERRSDLSRLGLLAMVGGAIASHMTAAVIGVLL